MYMEVRNTKKILHQKFKLGELNVYTQQKVHECVKNLVETNDLDYIVVTTPTDLEVLEDNQAIIRIDAKEYTLKELMETIEKAAMYDDLCK